MVVALLGAGRLGRTLALLLPQAGHPARLWRRGEPVPAADVYWVTSRDAGIGEVAALLPPDAVALHASGALGPEALGERAERGVLHPLMTFPGPEVGVPDIRGAGARVEGTPRAVAAATRLATDLGMVPFTVPGDRRLYHAAACLASGHLAATFAEAVGVLVAAGVAPDRAPGLLYPLAAESLRRVAEAGPTAITGPAARGDLVTQEAHRAALSGETRAVYEVLSAAIGRLRSQDQKTPEDASS